MVEEFDVNKEYEKIFGTETRENLFGLDDEEYQNLRQSIIESKRLYNLKKSLPFEGVKLFTYEVFLRNEIVREAESLGFRIFYIRKYCGNKLYVYAAGYFSTKDSRFVVLKGAFFPHSEYFSSLTSHVTMGARLKFTRNYKYDNGVMTQKRQWAFDSAALAASYILGKKSTFFEWKDDRNKTLDAYYARYKSASIYELEDRTFPDYVPLGPLFQDYGPL